MFIQILSLIVLVVLVASIIKRVMIWMDAWLNYIIPF